MLSSSLNEAILGKPKIISMNMQELTQKLEYSLKNTELTERLENLLALSSQRQQTIKKLQAEIDNLQKQGASKDNYSLIPMHNKINEYKSSFDSLKMRKQLMRVDNRSSTQEEKSADLKVIKKILQLKKIKQQTMNDKDFDSRNYSLHLPNEQLQKRDYITSFQQYMMERKRRQEEEKNNVSNSPNKIIVDRSEIDKEINLNVQGNLIQLRLPQIRHIQSRRPALRELRHSKGEQTEKQIRKFSQYSRPVFQAEIHKSQDIKVNVKKVKKRNYGNYFDMNIIINWANKLFLDKSNGPYKAYVGAGNNQQLVKYILKQRSQWILANKDEEGINLVWTQKKKKKYFIEINKKMMNNFVREMKSGSIKILEQSQQMIIDRIWKKYEKLDMNKLNNQSVSYLKIDEMKLAFSLSPIVQPIFIHNHIWNNEELGDKKVLNQNNYAKQNLLFNLRQYYLSQDKDLQEIIPTTFYVNINDEDNEYQLFQSTFQQIKAQNKLKNIWIMKPGENSNRGNGIKISSSLNEINGILKQKFDGKQRGFVIQKYIENPFLFNKRKVDIRCYILITLINQQKKAYWFQQGYLRTSSTIFNLEDLECSQTHLTNDAIQNKFSEYGKYEKGNKVSFEAFNQYLQSLTDNNFYFDITQIKKLAIQGVFSAINKFTAQPFPTFELYGIDFMFDDQFKPYLIEFNTNPCIETGCPVLDRVIGTLMENLFRLVIDPLFPNIKAQYEDFLKRNYFEIFYSEDMT